MTSYLRSWLYGAGTVDAAPSTSSVTIQDTPTIEMHSPPASDDGEDTETERGKDDDDDEPPAFPALNSAQRVQTQKKGGLTDAQLMPPPLFPASASRTQTAPNGRVTFSNSSLGVKGSSQNSSSSPSTLALPPTTIKAPTSLDPNKKKKGNKVALAPGHSALDWAALKSSGADLRGVDTLLRIPPSVLKKHNKKDDAWSAFNGKVYNMTAYFPFHPGGEKDLMRVAGRDGTKLFASTHAWVNVDFMLDACLVGFLVPEPDHADDSD